MHVSDVWAIEFIIVIYICFFACISVNAECNYTFKRGEGVHFWLKNILNSMTLKNEKRAGDSNRDELY